MWTMEIRWKRTTNTKAYVASNHVFDFGPGTMSFHHSSFKSVKPDEKETVTKIGKMSPTFNDL